jgi:hypothetical protein
MPIPSECHVQYEMKSFRSSLRVKNDFNIAIDALIEFLKCSGRRSCHGWLQSIPSAKYDDGVS